MVGLVVSGPFHGIVRPELMAVLKLVAQGQTTSDSSPTLRAVTLDGSRVLVQPGHRICYFRLAVEVVVDRGSWHEMWCDLETVVG